MEVEERLHGTGKTVKTSLFIITTGFKISYCCSLKAKFGFPSFSSACCMPLWNPSTSTLSPLDAILYTRHASIELAQ